MELIVTTNIKEINIRENKKSNLNIGFGLVDYKNHKIINEDSNLLIRCLGWFDLLCSKYYSQTKEEEEILNCLINTTKKLKDLKLSFNNKKIEIQIVSDSSLNKLLLNLNRVFAIKKLDDLLKYYDSHEKSIYSLINSNKVFIGTKSFKSNGNLISKDLLEKIKLERATQFVVFHEYAHTLEKFNLMGLDLNSSKIIEFLNKCKNKNFINKLNEISENNNDIKDIISNLGVLGSEIYADVMALLIIRNILIKENGTKAQFIDLIKKIKEARTLSHLNKTLNDKGLYIKNVGHFTSVGLDVLETLILKNERFHIIGEKEINDLSSQCVVIGISRMIFSQTKASIKMNDNYLKIFKIINDEINYFEIINEKVGINWLNGFKYKLKKLILNNNINTQVFDLGVRAKMLKG